MTLDEMLSAWDRGESIWSIELGGLGPGYEQAIQVAAVEFARAGKGMARTDDEKADYRSFDELCSGALRAFDEKLGGITGAMFGAAKWLAWQWCFNGGPDGLLERMKSNGQADRAIQCSNSWPHVPTPGEAFRAGLQAGERSKP